MEQRDSEPDYRYVTRERLRTRAPNSRDDVSASTYNILLFMLLVIFLSMVILIITLCKMSQVQKSIDVLAMIVLNGHGS